MPTKRRDTTPEGMARPLAKAIAEDFDLPDMNIEAEDIVHEITTRLAALIRRVRRADARILRALYRTWESSGTPPEPKRGALKVLEHGMAAILAQNKRRRDG